MTSAFFFIVVVVFFLLTNQEKKKNASSAREKKLDQTKLLMGLAAVVIKSDGRVYPKELEIVKQRLSREFSKPLVDRYMSDLQFCLRNKLRVTELAIAANGDFNASEKYQVVHFLVSLVVSNGKLTDYEYETLRKLSIGMGFGLRGLHSILAMFHFERIAAHEKTTGKKKGKKKTKTHHYRARSEAEKAYEILEIDASAGVDEIKSAYRKLAKVHHPDRVIHLGPEFQKGAKEKFQQLANAYETIKKMRNF